LSRPPTESGLRQPTAAKSDPRAAHRWASDTDIDRLCEQILLASGEPEEAYARYAISANRAATYVGWFRAVAKKYPDKPPGVVLADLVRHTPGEQGKWFAAAKDAKLFDEAVALANATPCDPKTRTRAARDFAQTNPTFSVEAGLAALHWLAHEAHNGISSSVPASVVGCRMMVPFAVSVRRAICLLP
jgi:hypothetical protein